MRILSHKRQHFSQYNSSVSNLHFRKHLIVSRVQQFDIKAIQSRSSPAQRISRRLKTPQLPKPQEFPEMLQLTRSRTYPDDGMDLDIETSVVKKKVRFGPFSTPPTGNTYSVRNPPPPFDLDGHHLLKIARRISIPNQQKFTIM